MTKPISIDEFKKIFDANTNCILIDVRELAEYETVRIPHSKLMSLSTFDQNCYSLEKEKPLYFLCGIGKRAQKAAEYLESLGYKNLYVIEGGIKAWIEANYPVLTKDFSL